MAEQVLPSTLVESAPLPLPKFEEGLGAALIQLLSSTSSNNNNNNNNNNNSPSGTVPIGTLSPGLGAATLNRNPSITSVVIKSPAGKSNAALQHKSNNGASASSTTTSVIIDGNNKSTLISITGSLNSTAANVENATSSNGQQSSTVSGPGPKKMAIGRRESPLDLSVKTVRQSADSSTSSMLGLDILALAAHNNYMYNNNNNNAVSSCANVVSRSMPGSGSSTPNSQQPTTTTGTKHHQLSNGGGESKVVAAPANSTTGSLKDHPAVEKLAGPSSTTSSSSSSKGRKGHHHQQVVTSSSGNGGHVNGVNGSASASPSGLPPASVPYPQQPLFHHTQSAHSIHAMHAASTRTGPAFSSSQLNLHPSHGAPPSQHQQQPQQPQRPSSVLSGYHHPPPPISPYPPQYAQTPSPHLQYSYNPQYYSYPGVSSPHTLPASNGPPSQPPPHYNYYTTYNGPPVTSSLPPASSGPNTSGVAKDTITSSSHSNGLTVNSKSVAVAPTSSSANTSAHPPPPLSYPTSKSLPLSYGNSAPLSAPYGGYPSGMVAPVSQPGQYYPPGVPTPRPGDQMPGLSQYGSLPPNHQPTHHYSQPYPYQSPYGYHPHGASIPHHLGHSAVKNPAVPHFNDTRSLGAVPGHPTPVGTPNSSLYPPIGPSATSAAEDRSSSSSVPATSKGPISHSLKPSVNSSSTTSKTKSNSSKSSNNPRDSKNGKSQKVMDLLRTTCESRLHEKEKEKFQFNHQTWNFQGRTFNTVLPSTPASTNLAAGSSSSSNSYNYSALGLSASSSSDSSKSNLAPSLTSASTSSGKTEQGSASSVTSLHSKSDLPFAALSTDNDANGLNRIRTKAEKKQLFPNLYSQIEQENREKTRCPQKLGVNNAEIRTHAQITQPKLSKSETSVFDFQEDELDVSAASKSPVKPKSPSKPKSCSSRKNSTGSQSPVKSVTPHNSHSDSCKTAQNISSVDTVTTVKQTVIDNNDNFWQVCDSFVTDLASNPTTITSRRGGLWQKIKSKVNPSKSTTTNKSPSKTRRTYKNSSDEDSDFKVDEEEVKSEEKSEEEEEESSADDDDEATSKQSDSDDVVGSSRKRKTRVIHDDEDEEDEDSVRGAKRRKVSPVGKTRDKRNSKRRAGRNLRSRGSKNRKTRQSTKRDTSDRRKGGLSISDLDDGSEKSSLESESEEASSSSHSYSVVSGSFDSEASDSASDSDKSDGSSDSDSENDLDSDDSSAFEKRKSKRRSARVTKNLRSSTTKSLRSRTKETRSSKRKRDKKQDKMEKSTKHIQKSLRNRNQRNLRPKRNCTKGASKDGSVKSEPEKNKKEEESEEEWIGMDQLGKKKRRIAFGDGSDFHQPGWEEELIDYKKKNRMPHKLIAVAKPSSLSNSFIGGSSTASSVCNIKDVEPDSGKGKSSDKSENKKSLGKRTRSVETKSPATPNSKGRGRSKDEKSLDATSGDDPVKTSMSLRERPKSPEKAPASKTTPKKQQDKDKSKTGIAVAATITKDDVSVTPPKQLKKEAHMLPTSLPGASGNKFAKKLSIKSVFGVDVNAPEKEPDLADAKATGKENTLINVSDAPTPVVPTPPVKKASRRNKFKSGFDYIRKKKKTPATPEGSVAPTPKKIKTIEKELNVEDAAAEMRGWVLRKELGETILHRAARLGYPDVASYCLEHDVVSPNCKDNAGYTPLHETCIKGTVDVAKVLLAYGANPSQAAPGGIRPLHEAVENGHVELVRLLISYGADPQVATYAGQTPLELAESNEPVRLLLQEHIKDLQGKQDTPWIFRGSGPWADAPYDNGYEITDCPPSPGEPADPDAFEFEASDNCLPPLYKLKGEVAFYILLQDLLNFLGQPKERFMKNHPNAAYVELNANDFLEQAHCCHLLGEKFNLNSSSDLLTLIRYDDHIKKMLSIESVFIK